MKLGIVSVRTVCAVLILLHSNIAEGDVYGSPIQGVARGDKWAKLPDGGEIVYRADGGLAHTVESPDGGVRLVPGPPES